MTKAQVEVITSVQRRRRWSRAEKERIVAAALEPHEGHVTGAARRLNLSQSAVSTQIGLLEKRLRHALFHREKRALRLTEAGRIALDHADALFGIGGDLVATLKRKGAKRLALHVGAIATLSRKFQMAFLRPVLGRVDVEIAFRSASAAELYEGLAEHHLDVVLTNHPPPFDATTPYVAHRLAEQPISLIGVPRLCAPRLSLPNRLSQVPLILPAAGTGRTAGRRRSVSPPATTHRSPPDGPVKHGSHPGPGRPATGQNAG